MSETQIPRKSGPDERAARIFADWSEARRRGDFAIAARCRLDLLKLGYCLSMSRPTRLVKLQRAGVR